MGSNHARYIFRAFTQVKDVCNNMQMSFVKEIFVVRNTYQESMMALQPDQKSLTLPPQSNHLTEMVSYNKWVGGGGNPPLTTAILPHEKPKHFMQYTVYLLYL